MILLKPGRRLFCQFFGLDEGINPLAEGRIGQYLFDFLPGDGLQDIPGMMSQIPKYRIKLPPHIVG